MKTFFEAKVPSTVYFASNLPIKTYHIGGIGVETSHVRTWDELRDNIAEKINEKYRSEGENIEVDPDSIKIFVYPEQKLYTNENQPEDVHRDIFSKFKPTDNNFPMLCSTRELGFTNNFDF